MSVYEVGDLVMVQDPRGFSKPGVVTDVLEEWVVTKGAPIPNSFMYWWTFMYHELETYVSPRA